MASEIEEVAGAGFRQFDVVTDYSDHSFAKAVAVGTNNQGVAASCFSNAKSGVYKKIMREWKILGESLPETIYVRTYESRIDLLRAVIIGAQGTPYHDGLFFFDIALPQDYPNSPPKVHYRSFGLMVNPYLYANGFICLSLLNTRPGYSKCERWNPNCSSVLQILVSIQALVLKAKPYYFKLTNDKSFALTCKTMHFTLKAPPLHFKDFVTAHFRERGCNILNAIDAYKNGSAPVGYFNESSGKKKSSKVSKILIKDLDMLYNMLFADFSMIKVPGLEKLRPPINSASNGMTSASKANLKQSRSNKKSILGQFRSKVKKIFMFGKKKSSPKKTEV